MVAPYALSASSKNAKWSAHQSSEPPWVITVSTRAPDEHRSQRSPAVGGRAGVLSSEAFIPSTPPHLAGNSFGTASPIGGLGLPPDLVRRGTARLRQQQSSP